MAEQKTNDWLAVLFFSPDKSPQDLADLGITTDNSSLQDIDYYKNIPQIQEAFKNESGNFDNVKFEKYYKSALQLYNYVDNAKLEGDVTNFYDYDPYDNFAPIDGKERDVAPHVIKIANPQRRGRGLTNLREITSPTMSIREVAQQNKVFNIDTGKFEEWTPNDWGGLSSVTRPTVVLAQWDEDGTHEINGRIVSHNAGDYKFNEDGDPFYETLGKRSISGKDILHISDTFTVDGSKWNKYDPFDSDGLDKSVTLTVLKTLLKVAPMFIPHVGKIYGAMGATIELGKLLPALYKSVEGIATGDISTSNSAQKATDMQAWFSRFDSSMSDRGRQGFFNMENLGKLIEDSSLQLFQQRVISNIPLQLNKLRGKPVSENAIKWGRGLALAYMAGTSSTEAYDAFKEAGANDRVAGLGMISVMGSMFTLMNNDYFKDFLFRGSALDKTKIKSVIKESAEQLTKKEFASATAQQIATPKGAANWVVNMQKALTKRISSMGPDDLLYGAFNEGVEETVEEISMDAVKAFFSGLNSLGIIEEKKSYDFGFSPEDMFSRYMMSFAGGAVGGAVFNMHNKWESRKNPTVDESIKKGGGGLEEMIYLLRSGKEKELRTELNRLYGEGKLASTNLSGTEFEVIKEGTKYNIQYKAAEKGSSQNDLIYKQLNNYIDRISEVVKEEGLDISDAELQYITEQAEVQKSTVEEAKQAYLRVKKLSREATISEQIVDSGLYNSLFDDWNNLTSEIVKTKVELEGLLTPGDTESQTPRDVDAKIEAVRNSSEYKQLKLKLDNLRKERDAIIKGERNDYYTGQLLFAASPHLVNNFISGFGIHNFTRYKYNKNYDSLSPEERAKIDEEYKVYSKTSEKARVLAAYNIFSEMQEKLSQNVKQTISKIKDSSQLYIAETTQYKLIQANVNNEIKKRRDAIEEALKKLPEGISTTEEINKLRNEITELETYLEGLKDFKFGVLPTALSQSGFEVLKRPKHFIGNNYSVNNEEFRNYAESYKEFLKTVRDNELYLDLVDSDLASILQLWISRHNIDVNNSASWENKIIEAGKRLGETFDPSDPFISSLAGRIANIVGYLNNNDIESAIRAYDEIQKSDLRDKENFIEISIKELVDSTLPTIGDNVAIDYLRDVHNLKSQIGSSPIYDLIEEASRVAGTDNWEIIGIIRKEQVNFLNSKSVEDYIIRDVDALVRLKETVQIIDAISAILDSSVIGGLNSHLNSFRELLGKELLPIATKEEVFNIVKDLNKLSTQIQTLIEISERNQAQKLREQRDIAINMRKKFIDLLTDPSRLIAEEFSSAFGINLEELKKSFNIPLTVSEDNYEEFEIAAIKLETAIFTHINSLNLSSNDIAQRLVKLFNLKNLVNSSPTKLSKDPDTVITDFDALIYLASIIATPSQNFYNKLSEVANDPEFTNAPIFSQEYAVRVGYSQILNKEIFNSIIFQIKQATNSTSDDEYIQTKSALSNILTIYGGAGVGKTKGVAYLLRLMLSDAAVLTSAPTRSQADNLSDSIKYNGKSFTKNELIEKILGRPLDTSDIKAIGDISVTADVGIDVSSDNIFGDSEVKILFIDEISWYNRIELELISKWARKNGVMVIALGDYKQNSASIIYNNKIQECGVEDTFIIKTPDLVAPLRQDNIAKYDNYMKLSIALDSVYNQYYKNPSITREELNSYTSNYLNANRLELKYFEDSENFGGEKFINSRDVYNYIEKFKRLSNDVAIITDNPEKYNTIKGVKVVPLNSVQGEEFDYVIIDKDFGIDSMSHGRGDYLKLKDLYTLSQRSRKGTVITFNRLNDNFLSKLDPTSSGNISIPQSQITDFKNWRIGLLSSLPKESIFWDPAEDEISSVDNGEEFSSEGDKDVDNRGLSVEKSPVESAEKDSTKENLVDDIPKKRKPKTKHPLPKAAITKPASQAPYSSTPAPVNNINGIMEPSVISDIPHNREVTSLHRDEVVSYAESYIDFMQNDLFKYYKKSERSLLKYLNIKNTEKVKSITHLLRSYFVYGFYKTDTQKNSIRSEKGRKILNKLARDINRNSPSKITSLLDAPHQFVIIPYNQRGLLVARIGEVDIPLMIVDPIIGEYNGDIEIASPLKYDNIQNGDFLSIVNITNFKQSEINTDKLFHVFQEPVIISALEKDIESFNDSQKMWVWGDWGQNKPGNNGRTFFVVSGNPLLDASDFTDFLAPTIENNKITWTTQHNDSIALIGMNWVVDFDTILNISRVHSNNKHAQSIINAQRAGSIIGIANTVAPDIISSRIISYLNSNPQKAVKIGDTVVKGSDSVDNIFEQIKGKDIDIVFGYIGPNNSFKPENKGEWSISRIFGNIRNANNLDQAQIDEISRLIKESPKFRQGIYARDIRREDINGIYKSTDQDHEYVTNIKQLVGNDFKIDATKIRRVGEPPKISIVNKLNDQLREFGFNRIISDDTEIESIINSINEEILSTVAAPEYTILAFDGDNITTITITDERRLIANYLKVPVDSINISNKNTSNFVPFYVSLQDQTVGYVIEYKQREWSIREFPIINEHNELVKVINDNLSLIRSNTRVSKYITALLENQEIDLTTAEDYWTVVSVDPKYDIVRQQINKYLTVKLMNNEC